MVTPSGSSSPRNSYHPIIAYIGVLPAHRGTGYIDDLLAEGTRILAAHDVPRIRAAIDLDNVPMARAFQRARRLREFRAGDRYDLELISAAHSGSASLPAPESV
jgi:RimJ/RimL family protein N-acetyltransferase